MAKKRAPVVLNRDEWLRVFSQADLRCPTGRRDRALYHFIYYTGIRVGEACYLRLNAVDLRAGRFTVPREGKTGQRTLGIPKSPRLYDMLEAWLEVRAEWGVDSEYFFCTRTGGRMNEQNIAHTLSKRAVKAGIDKKVHPHGMRHSYASERAREGVTAPVLMNELGHTSLRTTEQYLKSLGTYTVESMQSRVVD